MPFSSGGSNHLCKKNLRGLKAIHSIDHKGLRGIGRGTITYCLCYSNRSIQACTNPLASSTWSRESLKLIHHQKFSFTKIWLLATQFEIRQLNLKAALQILCNAIGKTPNDKEDRPLFVQFCVNDPDIFLEAAKREEPFCDYVDINLGLSLDERFMNLLFCLSRFCFFRWLFLGRV